MSTVIFLTEKATFKFDKKEVTEHLIACTAEYDSDEVTQLLELISADCDVNILILEGWVSWVNIQICLSFIFRVRQ